MRTTTTQLHVYFPEPSLGIRGSFDAHTRNMSGRCAILPRPPGVEFARFLVTRGQVSRAGYSGEASPRELDCVINTLREVEWNGNTYHPTLEYSTTTR